MVDQMGGTVALEFLFLICGACYPRLCIRLPEERHVEIWNKVSFVAVNK
jgi:hypothetical protein